MASRTKLFKKKKGTKRLHRGITWGRGQGLSTGGKIERLWLDGASRRGSTRTKKTATGMKKTDRPNPPLDEKTTKSDKEKRKAKR